MQILYSKRFTVLVYISALAFSFTLGSQTLAASDRRASQTPFLIFDATNYTNKPSLHPYGIRPLPAIHQFFLKGENLNVVPSDDRIRELANQAKQSGSDICFLNIEHWPTHEAHGDWKEGLRKYLEVLRKFKQEVPWIKVGYYSHPPVHDYWRTVRNPTDKIYREWQRDCDRLAPLAAEVDILYPSLYTFYSDRDGWARYSMAQLRESRRYPGRKPVYAFLWPQYHNSNKLIGETFIEADFWRSQLDMVRKYADGIVIWGGWDFEAWKPFKWDESAPWWIETKAFLRGSPARP